MSASGVLCDLAFKRLDFRSKNKTLRFENAIDGGSNLVSNRCVLGLQIE